MNSIKLANFQLQRYPENPIISPKPGSDWESLVTLNPGTILDEESGEILMLYRAAADDEEHRAILPKETECRNLSVPICVSATHAAYGSIRMEPVFMILGQSAAIAAAIAIRRGKSLHSVDYKELLPLLVKAEQRLE
jgi:hypothetical protein